MDPEAIQPLVSLARAYGLETSHVDGEGQAQAVSPEVLLAALRALGAPLESESGAVEALRELRLEQWRRPLEPVTVHWQGSPLEIEMRLPEKESEKIIPLLLRLEDGWFRRLQLSPGQASLQERREVEGTTFLIRRWRIDMSLPPGTHTFRFESGDSGGESHLISAPVRAYAPPESAERRWGLFLPLYALHSESGWGAGDFGELRTLMEWTRAQGGHALGTLPFLSSFLEKPCDPSPYSPVSRLFWNEFYLDLERIPELSACPEARALLGSPECQGALQAFRAAPRVDYRGIMAMKRRVLELLAASFFSGSVPRSDSFENFLQEHPQAEDYARFRATAELQHGAWRQWPERLRSGRLEPGDFREEARRYHLYAQWQAEEQVASLGQTARDQDLRLYLDLPLGIHPQGYDAWREQALFAAGVSVGAPPDAFFAGGQDWGFPPPLPQVSRAQGHAYFRAALKRQLSAAGMLRIDHVLGLHRLLWIPDGFSPREGCYLRYPAEEYYALLCLESHRYECILVGEDLGTVPPELRPAMEKRGLLRSYVAPFELNADAQAPLVDPPPDSVASLNTHDLPTFAGYWEGSDLEERVKLGFMEPEKCAQEKSHRRALRKMIAHFLHPSHEDASESRVLLQAFLNRLAESEAAWLLINLEDLWGERSPQNVPGTSWERPNWLRKAWYSFEKLIELPEVLQALQEVRKRRPQSFFSRQSSSRHPWP